ncbi:hypothetical protein NP493_1328g00025 [Ridgeia piscesae]|uniref:Uncharacterized protein n=1 Tax=Ridgeia piscesae TaxID=27915 RepID=A0AAD9NDL0_RIDPI|nr:hypothetical protein NP493_1328g00025 [Ridgeia piscesae]
MCAFGERLQNIWFIPHYTEVLALYKHKDLTDKDRTQALSNHLTIVSALHDILQYLCAHARLGTATARMGSRNNTSNNMTVPADWGGMEGIGSELREIQKQIDNMKDKTSPCAVGQFLTLRREVMFLEFDVAVRHCMRETFLATNNVAAYKVSGPRVTQWTE